MGETRKRRQVRREVGKKKWGEEETHAPQL